MRLLMTEGSDGYPANRRPGAMTIADVAAARRNQVPLGIAYMVGSTAMFAGGNAGVKWQLATYPLGEVAFGRTLFAFPTVAAIVLPRAGWSVLRTRRYREHLQRGLSQLCSMLCWCLAVSVLSLGSATALGFAAPLFPTLLSIVILEEKVGIHRWSWATIEAAQGYDKTPGAIPSNKRHRPDFGVRYPSDRRLPALGTRLPLIAEINSVDAITQTAAPNDAGTNRPPNPPFIRSGHLTAPGFSDHRIYWEEYGTLAGEPVMVMHGGPGGGSPASAPRFFDPQRYRVILFD